MTQLQFKLFIFCNNNSAVNNPTTLTDELLISGIAFSTVPNISLLGIQAPPGTKFYINGSTNPAIVGFTGLFEISLEDGGSISKLSFDRKSLSYIQSNDSAMLIIDIAYWTGADL